MLLASQSARFRVAGFARIQRSEPAKLLNSGESSYARRRCRVLRQARRFPYLTFNNTLLAACSVFLPSRRESTTNGCSIGLTHGSA